MRRPQIRARDVLAERFTVPVDANDGLPETLESFLAHLRLLIGVPFEYLVPDPRLLPRESIRFFYVDRSYTDRLVDGALSVGKAGSNEQAHHQERHADLRARLDTTERAVRVLQRGLSGLESAVATAPDEPAGVVTGLVLRSSAVAAWPDMEVRAFDETVADDAPAETLTAHGLRLLRLERIAPSVLLALFDGIPKLVWLEEPLHGVPIALRPTNNGLQPFGHSFDVPFRAGGHRVIHMTALRRAVLQAVPGLPPDAGAGSLAEATLGRAYRQRFEGDGARVRHGGSGPAVRVSERVEDEVVARRLEELLR